MTRRCRPREQLAHSLNLGQCQERRVRRCGAGDEGETSVLLLSLSDQHSGMKQRQRKRVIQGPFVPAVSPLFCFLRSSLSGNETNLQLFFSFPPPSPPLRDTREGDQSFGLRPPSSLPAEDSSRGRGRQRRVRVAAGQCNKGTRQTSRAECERGTQEHGSQNVLVLVPATKLAI